MTPANGQFWHIAGKSIGTACPLLRVKRTCRANPGTSVLDPQRTSAKRPTSLNAAANDAEFSTPQSYVNGGRDQLSDLFCTVPRPGDPTSKTVG